LPIKRGVGRNGILDIVRIIQVQGWGIAVPPTSSSPSHIAWRLWVYRCWDSPVCSA
jgi:hypothetical protein